MVKILKKRLEWKKKNLEAKKCRISEEKDD